MRIPNAWIEDECTRLKGRAMHRHFECDSSIPFQTAFDLLLLNGFAQKFIQYAFDWVKSKLWNEFQSIIAFNSQSITPLRIQVCSHSLYFALAFRSVSIFSPVVCSPFMVHSAHVLHVSLKVLKVVCRWRLAIAEFLVASFSWVLNILQSSVTNRRLFARLNIILNWKCAISVDFVLLFVFSSLLNIVLFLAFREL